VGEDAEATIDSNRWLLVGQSAGGFASIYTASKRPEGSSAVLAFAARSRRTPGHASGLALRAGARGQAVRVDRAGHPVPVLWF